MDMSLLIRKEASPRNPTLIVDQTEFFIISKKEFPKAANKEKK